MVYNSAFLSTSFVSLNIYFISLWIKNVCSLVHTILNTLVAWLHWLATGTLLLCWISCMIGTQTSDVKSPGFKISKGFCFLIHNFTVGFVLCFFKKTSPLHTHAQTHMHTHLHAPQMLREVTGVSDSEPCLLHSRQHVGDTWGRTRATVERHKRERRISSKQEGFTLWG